MDWLGEMLSNRERAAVLLVAGVLGGAAGVWLALAGLPWLADWLR